MAPSDETTRSVSGPGYSRLPAGSNDAAAGSYPPASPYDDLGQATYFQAVNRNKASIALDLRDASDVARAKSLVTRSDVVVENFRPGVMDRLGLGYEELAALSPGLVYCSITGFGSGSGAPCPATTCSCRPWGGL
jgi:crotonobetainyl-CoA:carnitine CoA-transferase CaiB-like acyl-CoA transferase